MINEQHFTWGAFISAVITFVLTAAVVYFVVVLPVKAIMERRKRGEEAGPAEPTQVELLVEIRDLLRAQQGAASGARPVRARHDVAAGAALVAAPVRGAVLQVAAVVVRRVAGPLPPADVAVVRAPARAAAGAGAPGGSVGGHRLAEPLEHLGRRQRGQQRPRRRRACRPGCPSR